MNKEFIFFFSGSEEEGKREKTPESFTNWFLSGQAKKILCCTKHHFSNLLGELVIKHPPKHALLEIHICTSINMKQESREAWRTGFKWTISYQGVRLRMEVNSTGFFCCALSVWENEVLQRSGKCKVFHVSYATMQPTVPFTRRHTLFLHENTNWSYLENIRNCWLIETKMCFGIAHTNVNEWNIFNPL